MDLLNQTGVGAFLNTDETLIGMHSAALGRFMLTKQRAGNAFDTMIISRDEAEVLFRWLGHRLGEPSSGPSHYDNPRTILTDAETRRTVSRLEPEVPVRPGLWTLKVHGINVPVGYRSYDALRIYVQDTLRITYHHSMMGSAGELVTFHGCQHVPVGLPSWLVAEREGAEHQPAPENTYTLTVDLEAGRFGSPDYLKAWLGVAGISWGAWRLDRDTQHVTLSGCTGVPEKLPDWITSVREEKR